MDGLEKLAEDSEKLDVAFTDLKKIALEELALWVSAWPPKTDAAILAKARLATGKKADEYVKIAESTGVAIPDNIMEFSLTTTAKTCTAAVEDTLAKIQAGKMTKEQLQAKFDLVPPVLKTTLARAATTALKTATVLNTLVAEPVKAAEPVAAARAAAVLTAAEPAPAATVTPAPAATTVAKVAEPVVAAAALKTVETPAATVAPAPAATVSAAPAAAALKTVETPAATTAAKVTEPVAAAAALNPTATTVAKETTLVSATVSAAKSELVKDASAAKVVNPDLVIRPVTPVTPVTPVIPVTPITPVIPVTPAPPDPPVPNPPAGGGGDDKKTVIGSFYTDVSDIITNIGGGLAEAQRNMDLLAIKTQKDILEDDVLSGYGLTANWFVMPEAEFMMKLNFSAVDERTEEGKLKGEAARPKLKAVVVDATYKNLESTVRKEESSLRVRFVPIPMPPLVKVPDVVGLTFEAARTTLSKSAVSGSFIDRKGDPWEGENGIVKFQSIPGGNIMLADKTLVVSVEEYVPPPVKPIIGRPTDGLKTPATGPDEEKEKEKGTPADSLEPADTRTNKT